MGSVLLSAVVSGVLVIWKSTHKIQTGRLASSDKGQLITKEFSQSSILRKRDFKRIITYKNLRRKLLPFY